jgi:hypothetical protein
MIRWLKRIVIFALMIGLLVSNALTLTSSTFNALLSGALAGAIGVKTLSQLNREALDRQRSAVKRMGTRMKARTVKMASRSTIGNTVTWIPLVGTSLAIALTAWELSDLCEGMKDLDRLYQDMDIESESVPLDICTAPDGP